MGTAKTAAKKPASGKIATAKKTPATTKKTVVTAKNTAATTKRTAASASKPASTRVNLGNPSGKKPAASPTAIVKPLRPVSAPPAAAPRARSGGDQAVRVATSAEQRHKMIEQAAYFLAERNAFVGQSLDYWIAAELQVDTMLGRGKR